MEQIYTIPVNEAFDAGADGSQPRCPFCTLYRKLEEDELEIILGASMMEPDIRIKTNEMGFCLEHYRKMLPRKRRLGMGLILESHLARVKEFLAPSAKDLVLGPGAAQMGALGELEASCYVCARIERNLTAMISTAVYLWESDAAFREKFAKQPFFCLPHDRRMIEYARKKMNKKNYRAFYAVASGIVDTYLQTLTGDVSWFCKKFDYRYDEEPWYNSKDAVERAIRFLDGDNGDIG